MTIDNNVKSIFFLNYIILFSAIVLSVYYAHNLFVELNEKYAYKNLLTINSLAVKNVETHLQYVSTSVESLGKSYKKLYSQKNKHLNSPSTYQYKAIKNDKITFYNTSIIKEDYLFQSDHASIILSNLNQNSETITKELNIFHHLSPALESIYNSFNFSWIYFTTANNFLLIYPYVPFINASEAYKPTEQHFYNAANFTNKSVGWEEPYYDLVGGGILVTASYPVYDDSDNLLGVASHDITLDKMQEYVLDATSVYEGSVSFLISKHGKVISSSDKLYQSEVEEQSAHKYRGNFYYRTLENSKKIA
ncbi:cache domain-containing protein [Candidatus Sulfurimonas marisnigri]|uniref:cache domain-containing protein n=1 Tax=Candidatus Sulfurimonas marisnigri TaxID=2740405 RepID=UPI001E5A0B21|nr:cache domain-containing protein [Candidatus Sulfurimonas marisnigri]